MSFYKLQTTNYKLSSQSGFSFITSILVVLSVTLSIGLTTALLNMSQLELQNISIQGDIAFYVADACAEEATFRLKRDSNYAGETLNFTNGSCVISVAGTTTKTIDTTATVGTFTRKIRIVGSLVNNPDSAATGFSITSWEEKP